MRRGLVWALFGTLALSAAALFMPGPARVVEAAAAGAAERQRELLRVAGPPPVTDLSRRKAEEARAVGAITPATRDPFAAPLPIVADPPAPAPEAPAVAAPSETPPLVEHAARPEPPALALRFLGSLITPAGERLVFLARGEEAMLVSVGDRLEEGYVVRAIHAHSVTLVYPSHPGQFVVEIPPSSP